jgi:hypothetical protein
MKRSTDGGATWGSEETIVGITQFGALGNAGMSSLIKADNGDLIVVFETGQATDDTMKIGMVRSIDNGATWSGSISTVYDRPGSGGYAGAPFLVKMDDGTLVVSYQHHDGVGTQTMGYVTSSDHGATWSSNTDLFTDESWWPALFVDADGILYGMKLGVTFKKHYPGGAPVFKTVAHWRFEEGGNGLGATGQHAGDWDDHYTDVSGNGNHMSTWPIGGDNWATYTNNVPFATVPQTGDANNLSLYCDGGDQIATHSGHGGVSDKMLDTYSFTNGFTIEATFKLDTVTEWQGIISKDGKVNATDAQPAFRMKMTPWGDLEIGFFDTSGTPFSATIAAPYIQTGVWISIAATYDNNTLTVYGKRYGIDSGYSSLASVATHGNPAWLHEPARVDGGTGWSIDRGWRIGWVMWDGDPNAGNHIQGTVDEMRISNLVLAPSEFIGTLGAPPPDIGNIATELLPSGLALTWITSDLYTYALLEKANLTDPTWSTNQSGIPGGASSVTVTTTVDSVNAFYKVTSE